MKSLLSEEVTTDRNHRQRPSRVRNVLEHSESGSGAGARTWRCEGKRASHIHLLVHKYLSHNTISGLQGSNLFVGVILKESSVGARSQPVGNCVGA